MKTKITMVIVALLVIAGSFFGGWYVRDAVTRARIASLKKEKSVLEANIDANKKVARQRRALETGSRQVVSNMRIHAQRQRSKDELQTYMINITKKQGLAPPSKSEINLVWDYLVLMKLDMSRFEINHLGW